MFKFNYMKQNEFQGDSLQEAASSDAFLKAVGEYVEPEASEDETPVEEEVIEDVIDGEDDIVEDEEEVTEDSTEEQPEETDDEPEDETFLVTIDGEEKEVASQELLAGYQRQQDYTQKTQALAEERKKTEEYGKQLDTERTKYITAVEAIVKSEEATLSEYDNVDWEKLRAEDTNQFLLLQYEMKEKREAFEAKKQALDHAVKQQADEKAIKQSQFLQAENARVADLVEGWNGDNHQMIVDGISKQAQKEGFTEVDNDLFQHALVIKLLHKAQQYDEGQKQAKEKVGNKLVRKVPKVTKSKQVPSSEATKYKEAKKRLKQTGNIEDSVALFEQWTK
ncbi:hypothetical protein NVP1262O_11 [Vibrio phage 1.262.O._10N.286.51.A9]|nr:hypothetical protein NVP1262O_11 [Vibrio phage 1.262.O._10N.286.51.A9]